MDTTSTEAGAPSQRVQSHDSVAQTKFRAPTINVGSRKSPLALVQTETVIRKLTNYYQNNGDKLRKIQFRHGKWKYPSEDLRELSKCDTCPSFNVVPMSTTGDQVLDKPLPAIGTKSLFTAELESALLEGKIDFIVHSLKDLPTTLPVGCSIGAVLKRDSPEDVIVIKSSLAASTNAIDFLSGRNPDDRRIKIGTSSQRRIAMLKRCNPNIECIDIRGNLGTRFSKLDDPQGDYSAIILAKAGLDRMGWTDRSNQILEPFDNGQLDHWMYAVGQGAIAVECRSNDQYIIELISPVVDEQTMYEVIAERSLMKRLGAGCSVPLGVRSTWLRVDRDHILQLKAIVLSVDGLKAISASSSANLMSRQDYIERASQDAFSSVTTGVTVAKFTFAHVFEWMIKAGKLGLALADELIELGCLDLMRPDQ